MGIPPLFWGAKFWKFLHQIALSLDVKLSESIGFMRLQGIAEFFRAFARLLPCGDCTNHFLRELASDFNPSAGRWPKKYFEWTVEVRQRVARRVNRPEKSLAEGKPELNG